MKLKGEDMTEDLLQQIYNYRRLSENIGTAGQPTETLMKVIADSGFQVVINLALTSSDNALPDEAGLVQSLGMKYIHIPVVWEQPKLEDLTTFFQKMRENKGQKIFVHCAANMRVSTFMGLYQVIELGWPLEVGLSTIKSMWEPNGTWGAFIDDALSTLKKNG